MPQKIWVFEDKDVLVAVPAKYQGFDVVVEDKKPVDVPDPFKFKRLVINIGVHYLDKDKNKTALPKIKPFMQIWVGYEAGEEGEDLNYWDAVNGKKRPMVDKKDKFKHTRANKEFEGYGYAEMKIWGIDPNVGWG